LEAIFELKVYVSELKQIKIGKFTLLLTKLLKFSIFLASKTSCQRLIIISLKRKWKVWFKEFLSIIIIANGKKKLRKVGKAENTRKLASLRECK